MPLIGFDVATTNNTVGPSTSLTWNHTVSVKNHRMLFVGFLLDNGSDVVTGVTYGGVAMTRVGTLQGVNTQTGNRVYLYELAAPATGTNAIVISLSSSQTAHGKSSSYFNVKQSTVMDAAGSATTTAASPLTIPVTTIHDNCWTVCFWLQGGSNTCTPNAGTTIRGSDAGTTDTITLADSNGVKHPAGATSLGCAFPAADSAGVIVSMAPVDDGQMFACL